MQQAAAPGIHTCSRLAASSTQEAISRHYTQPARSIKPIAGAGSSFQHGQPGVQHSSSKSEGQLPVCVHACMHKLNQLPGWPLPAAGICEMWASLLPRMCMSCHCDAECLMTCHPRAPLWLRTAHGLRAAPADAPPLHLSCYWFQTLSAGCYVIDKSCKYHDSGLIDAWAGLLPSSHLQLPRKVRSRWELGGLSGWDERCSSGQWISSYRLESC